MFKVMYNYLKRLFSKIKKTKQVSRQQGPVLKIYFRFLASVAFIGIVTALYVIYSHLHEPSMEELFIGITNYALSFQVWNLVYLAPGIITGFLLLSIISLLYLFLNENLKKLYRNKHFVSNIIWASLLIIALIISNIFNLNLAFAYGFIKFIVALAVYLAFYLIVYGFKCINSGRIAGLKRNCYIVDPDSIVKMFILPIGLIAYRFVIVLHFVAGLFSNKYSKLSESKILKTNINGIKFALNVLQLILTSGLVLVVLQIAMFLLAKANPVFNELLYEPIQPYFKYSILFLEMLFGIITLITGSIFVIRFEVFEQKSLENAFTNIQKAVDFILSIKFIRFLLISLITIGYIFVATNFYAIYSYHFANFTFKNGLNAFIYRGIWVSAVAVIVTLAVLFITKPNTQKNYNNLFLSLKLLNLFLILDVIIKLLVLVINYGSTTPRLLGILFSLCVWGTTLFIMFIDKKLKKDNFFILDKWFNLYTRSIIVSAIVYLTVPWFLVNLGIWQALLPHKSINPQYFYNKENIMHTYLYSSKLKQIFKDTTNATLFRDFLGCYVNTNLNFKGRVLQTNCNGKINYNYDEYYIESDFVYPQYGYYGYNNFSFNSYSDINKLVRPSSKLGNIYAARITKATKSIYTSEYCYSVYRTMDKRLRIELLKTLKMYKDQDIRKAIVSILNGNYKLKIAFTDLDTSKITFHLCQINKKLKNAALPYELPPTPFYDLTIKLVYNAANNSFEFKFLLPDLLAIQKEYITN